MSRTSGARPQGRQPHGRLPHVRQPRGRPPRGRPPRGRRPRGRHPRGAHLAGAILAGADLARAPFAGADLRNAKLRSADLRGANLRGANLIDAKLRGADLRGADLKYANLADADLARADLAGARLTSEEESCSYGSGSFLDLSTCAGVETATFSEADFLPRYLTDAFEYAHRTDSREAERWPYFVSRALKRIKALLDLYPDSVPPDSLVEAIQTITAELIQYLAKHPKAMYEIKPRQFEELIDEILASYGWQVHLTKATRDGGYDLFAISKDPAGVETSWMIECKKYRKVGIDVARALYGVKTDLKVASMMLATTSYFSRDLHAYKASRYDLELRDYEGILEWLNEYRPNPNGRLYIKDNRLVMPGDLDFLGVSVPRVEGPW